MTSSLLAFALCAASAANPVNQLRVHPPEYWRAIADAGYKVPAGERAATLLKELAPLAGARDPLLRDDLGYGIASHWLASPGLLEPEELNELVDLWRIGMRADLGEAPGEAQGDSVLRRSFSALDLSLAAAVDLQRPFLGRERFAALLKEALDTLAGERDLRGWQPDLGWIHATAHLADLLKFLGRNPLLEGAEQARILDAIAAKVSQPAQGVFAFGEDERLARAIESVLARPDFEPEALEAFLAACADAVRRAGSGTPLDPARFAAAQNTLHLLRALHVRLALDAGRAPALADARDAVLATLGTL